MGPLPVCLLAAALLGAPAKPARSDPARVAELVRTVADPATADADRRAAEEELRGHDPVPALPLVIAELERAGLPHDFADRDPRPEVRARAPAGRALVRLWGHYMSAAPAVGGSQAPQPE
jgi:hypothetical protein